MRRLRRFVSRWRYTITLVPLLVLLAAVSVWWQYQLVRTVLFDK